MTLELEKKMIQTIESSVKELNPEVKGVYIIEQNKMLAETVKDLVDAIAGMQAYRKEKFGKKGDN